MRNPNFSIVPLLVPQMPPCLSQHILCTTTTTERFNDGYFLVQGCLNAVRLCLLLLQGALALKIGLHFVRLRALRHVVPISTRVRVRIVLDYACAALLARAFTAVAGGTAHSGRSCAERRGILLARCRRSPASPRRARARHPPPEAGARAARRPGCAPAIVGSRSQSNARE